MSCIKYFKSLTILLFVMSIPLGAQARELVTALLGPKETAYGQAMVKFAERLGELTNGELTVNIYPDGQLGSNNETFEQVMGGQIDIAVGIPGVISEYSPSMQALVVPFVFKDFDHWEKTITGPIGQKINDQVKQLGDIQVLGYFGGAIRNLVSSKEVKDIESLSDLRIRLHPSEILNTAWSSVGIRPTVMSYGEIYNGLQLGVVDGLENEAEWILRMKFYEQAKYYVLTEHEIVTRPFLMSGKTFDSLTESQKNAVILAGKEAASFERKLEKQLDSDSRKELQEEYGMQFVNIDKDQFQQVVREALEPVIEKQGISSLVNEIISYSN